MATRTTQEPVDLYDILKDNFFRQTIGSIDGEVISAVLAKRGINYHPKELVEALTCLLTDGFIQLAYETINEDAKTYRIGFANKLSDDDDRNKK